MTSAFDLVAPLLGGTPIDPALEVLLREADVQVAALTTQVQALGVATASSAWSSLQRTLPVPPIAAPPFPDLPIDGRRVGDHGWEIGLTVPDFNVPLTGLKGATVERQDGRSVAVASGGDADLRVTGGRVTVSAPSGSDPRLMVGSLGVEVDPPCLLLPGGFGVVVGEVTLGSDGVDLPELELLLPPLPQLPTGPVSVPAMLARAGGLFAETPPIDLPKIPGFRACSVAVTIDRPDATSLADLVPTRVEFTVPVSGVDVDVPGVGQVTGDSVDDGATNDITIVISSEGATFCLEGSLGGGGDVRGLLRVGSADADVAKILATAGALGPHLADGAGDAAQLAVLAGAAASLSTAVDAAQASFVLHSVSIAAQWSDEPPGVGDIDIKIDYECALPLSVSTQLGDIGTRDGSPYRVRHRDVAVRLAPTPGLSWRTANSTVVSPGDWTVPGPIQDLLRIHGIRTRKGSLYFEIDVALALDLDVVKVHGCTVGLHIDGSGVAASIPGFAASIDIPGTITGTGALEFGDGGFRAVLDVSLPALGAGGRAAAAKKDDLVMVAIEARLFAPIPLASSGLGLYGFGGVLAANAQPAINGEQADPILATLEWNPMEPDQWTEQSGQFWMGFGVDIGTVPDLGFALFGRGMVVIGVPAPAFRASLDVEALRGLGGALLGVLSIDEDGVIVAVRGTYDLSPLVVVTLPAGAVFPFIEPEKWNVRLGGDGSPDLGQPAMATVFPNFLTLEAWMFLMAFGDASTDVGGPLAGGRSVHLHGMSLAFGAGFEVEWFAGPFGFHAGGVVLAALTHRRTPDGGESPWVLSGVAEVHGRVDLGPVSIGASAKLEAFIDPASDVRYADARACASIDLWFTELKGCVHVSIGSLPQMPAPAPASPLVRCALTDRLGNVVAEPAEGGAAGESVVWPDAIPVLVFDTWVAEPAAGIAGLGRVVGDNSILGDGWIGTEELKYRFELAAVRVIDESTGAEVATSWSSAWQLPLTDDVFGTGSPARARSLALNVLDLHHWLQPAAVSPGEPGAAIGVLSPWCIPLPPPSAAWFPGSAASLPPSTPARLLADPPVEGLAIDLLLQDEFLYPADQHAPAMAIAADREYWPGAIGPARGEIVAADHGGDSVLWLPMTFISDAESTTVLVPTSPLRDVVVVLVAFENDTVRVRDHSGPWTEEDSQAMDDLVVTTWRQPDPGAYVDQIEILLVGMGGPVGLFGVSGVPQRADDAYAQAEAKRQANHDAVEAAANGAPIRRLLEPDHEYRLEVDLSWASAGSMYAAGGDSFETAVFRFTTAHSVPPRPPSQAPPPGPLQPLELLTATCFTARFGQSELADADLGRYVAGFVPEPATSFWFTDDPVQAHFLVDHLPELCDVYDSHLDVRARRTDAPDGTPPAVPVSRVDPVAPPAPAADAPILFPAVYEAFTALDRRRLEGAARMTDDSCLVPRPGAVTDLGTIEPQATYRLSIDVVREGGAATALRDCTITTSRYANPLTLFSDVGFRETDAEPLRAFPLPPSAAMPSPNTSFEHALEALELGGYPPHPQGQSAALWMHEAGDTWRLAGVLVECPEPIRRTGRLRIDGVAFDGVAAAGVAWDGTGSRCVALFGGHNGAPATVTMTFTDSPPALPSHSRTVTAPIAPYFGPVSP